MLNLLQYIKEINSIDIEVSCLKINAKFVFLYSLFQILIQKNTKWKLIIKK